MIRKIINTNGPLRAPRREGQNGGDEQVQPKQQQASRGPLPPLPPEGRNIAIAGKTRVFSSPEQPPAARKAWVASGENSPSDKSAPANQGPFSYSGEGVYGDTDSATSSPPSAVGSGSDFAAIQAAISDKEEAVVTDSAFTSAENTIDENGQPILEEEGLHYSEFRSGDRNDGSIRPAAPQPRNAQSQQGNEQRWVETMRQLDGELIANQAKIQAEQSKESLKEDILEILKLDHLKEEGARINKKIETKKQGFFGRLRNFREIRSLNGNLREKQGEIRKIEGINGENGLIHNLALKVFNPENPLVVTGIVQVLEALSEIDKNILNEERFTVTEYVSKVPVEKSSLLFGKLVTNLKAALTGLNPNLKNQSATQEEIRNYELVIKTCDYIITALAQYRAERKGEIDPFIQNEVNRAAQFAVRNNLRDRPDETMGFLLKAVFKMLDQDITIKSKILERDGNGLSERIGVETINQALSRANQGLADQSLYSSLEGAAAHSHYDSPNQHDLVQEETYDSVDPDLFNPALQGQQAPTPQQDTYDSPNQHDLYDAPNTQFQRTGVQGNASAPRPLHVLPEAGNPPLPLRQRDEKYVKKVAAAVSITDSSLYVNTQQARAELAARDSNQAGRVSSSASSVSSDGSSLTPLARTSPQQQSGGHSPSRSTSSTSASAGSTPSPFTSPASSSQLNIGQQQQATSSSV